MTLPARPRARPRSPSLVGLAGLALALVAGCGTSAEDEAVETVTLARGEIERRITAAGPVQPLRAVEVKSRASGEVLDLPFDAGQPVTQGTTVATIDPREEIEKVRLAEADERSARANLAKARVQREAEALRVEAELRRVRAVLERGDADLLRTRRELDRQRQLRGEDLTSAQALDAARAAFEVAQAARRAAAAEVELAEVSRRRLETMAQDVVLAEAQQTRAEVALARARERLQDTRIPARMDGVVLERKVEVGQIIASGISNVGGGTTLMVLADVSRLFVKAMVDEADIGRVHEGLAARVRCDAFPDQVFEGRVEWVAPLGVTENDVTAFEVLVEVLGEGVQRLRPGMTATCEFVAERRDDTLFVPPNALRQAEGIYYLNVLTEAGPPPRWEPRAVEVGLRNQDRVEVRGEGLRAGLEVLLNRPPGGDPADRGKDPIWFLKKKKSAEAKGEAPPPRRSSTSRP